jgi:hypothetical protein
METHAQYQPRCHSCNKANATSLFETFPIFCYEPSPTPIHDAHSYFLSAIALYR